MPRNPVEGLFWDDTPPPKPEKVQREKRTPPEQTWLDHLPGLEEARAFPVQFLTYDDLLRISRDVEELIVDVEVFPNYFLAVFTHVVSGKIFYLDSKTPQMTDGLRWILSNCLTVGFNSISYDLTICYLICDGVEEDIVKNASDSLIKLNINPSDILREHRVRKFGVNHIDLIEVAPLFASLKTYAGRLHAKKMQDLPFHPDTILTEDQILIVRWYCVNDTLNTQLLRECLREQIELRYELSNEFNIDLRSKSDAQIAEAVINRELKRITGRFPSKPMVPIGTVYQYRIPYYLNFQSDLMKYALNVVANAQFIVDHTGSIAMPKEIKDLPIDMNGSVYRMGIGGLHSSEQTVAHVADDEFILLDKDVISYYPFIILNLELAPQHLGDPFLTVYRSIVNKRVEAKRSGNKAAADSLKIVVNGTFGKLGNMHSIIYSPDLLFQVTLTGQLTLLLLIERLELAGIRVVSANTDGIVIKCPRRLKNTMEGIIKAWEFDTRFETEGSEFKALYSRDVNNYIAIKLDGKIKSKGAYAKPEYDVERLHKNPTSPICLDAVLEFLIREIPIERTIRACTDIAKFVSVRNVRGGAARVQPTGNSYIGRSIRWYYATGVEGELVYVMSGNKVPRSDGARELMVLPDTLPTDIDYEWYIREAERILVDIGAAAPPATAEILPGASAAAAS
jgi:hypothetical protein